MGYHDLKAPSVSGFTAFSMNERLEIIRKQKAKAYQQMQEFQKTLGG